ncbi:DUF397 domain-containing protein [Lentzea sp. NPDC051213]|uniref:DUF397 domain-containing protein n=1 Tax=Lentzea sp. NPDC051213 TaxID=3364126 RepID=UPI00378F387C
MINNWRTSSYTEPNGSCVRIGFTKDQHKRAAIGDTKDPDGPIILLSIDAYMHFVEHMANRGDAGPA